MINCVVQRIIKGCGAGVVSRAGAASRGARVASRGAGAASRGAGVVSRGADGLGARESGVVSRVDCLSFCLFFGSVARNDCLCDCLCDCLSDCLYCSVGGAQRVFVRLFTQILKLRLRRRGNCLCNFFSGNVCCLRYFAGADPLKCNLPPLGAALLIALKFGEFFVFCILAAFQHICMYISWKSVLGFSSWLGYLRGNGKILYPH